jgi:hypothetical protein
MEQVILQQHQFDGLPRYDFSVPLRAASGSQWKHLDEDDGWLLAVVGSPDRAYEIDWYKIMIPGVYPEDVSWKKQVIAGME